MPEYLAPGVYVEEVSFRSKSIEGVSTTTTGFIGPTLYGPINLVPELLTSFADFERTYGGLPQLEFMNSDGTTTTMDNYMAQAVRAFFEEGGTSCYVVRTFKPMSADKAFENQPVPYRYPPEDYKMAQADALPPNAGPQSVYLDGHARTKLHDDPALPEVHIRARFPGSLGNMRVRFTVRMGQNILSGRSVTSPSGTVLLPMVSALQPYDIVWISINNNAPGGSDFGVIGNGALHIAQPYTDPQTRVQTWQFDTLNKSLSPIQSEEVYLQSLNPATDVIRPITVTITVFPDDPLSLPGVWSNLALDPRHETNGTPDSLFDVFAEEPGNSAMASTLPIVIEQGEFTGLDVLSCIFAESRAIIAAQSDKTLQDVQTQLGNFVAGDARTRALSTDLARSVDIVLTGGNDGMRPGSTEYEGVSEENNDPVLNPKPFKTGFEAFKDLEDISILAAPGATFDYENANYQLEARTINSLLIDYATKMNLIAIIDSGNGQSTTQVREMRAQIDTTHAAFYYPWVIILDPVTRTARPMPPSGFVAGIYVRNDLNRAVFKAPANEVVNLALGFEKTINKAQQDVLNIEGINCFRYFEGRGYLLWGARTASSDPEWKYVNLRRYFVYLERSIDRGTQWAVFEPNGEALWGNVRRTIEDFLLNEFRLGALLGSKPEQAYFVRCDRSTMTQNDIDNGRLICLVGVAAIRPAEYVIIRIGQQVATP
ncbi:MAG TPA: phage tail sheath subtilisin-like domain-containing protein [Ktedonobacteraceae bacterium]|nr:phage tail sheath subtilisin-like domain-containing protein [Ktedonobacteraceae bacterium]